MTQEIVAIAFDKPDRIITTTFPDEIAAELEQTLEKTSVST